jgi:hypothetical protein
LHHFIRPLVAGIAKTLLLVLLELTHGIDLLAVIRALKSQMLEKFGHDPIWGIENADGMANGAHKFVLTCIARFLAGSEIG